MLAFGNGGTTRTGRQRLPDRAESYVTVDARADHPGDATETVMSTGVPDKCVCFYVGKGRNGLQTPERFSADLKRDKIPALLSPRAADARLTGLEGAGNGP